MNAKTIERFFHDKVSLIGSVILDTVNGLGFFTIYLSKVAYWFLRPPFRLKLFFDQMYFIGNKSIFIVILTSAFSGMVFAYQTYLGFSVINADSLVGPVVAIGLAKELGPVFTGLIVTGRCGAAMAAQIGTMKVTEQVDALEVMGINSIQYLSVPRIAASVLSMPMLCSLFLLIGNIGSFFIGTEVLKIDSSTYFSKLSDFMQLADVAEGLIKATCFGFMISIIGTYQGFNVQGGAEGVGKGTNMAVVWGMITILVMDFFLTSFLVKILGNG
jgi:phospholipid/cholesterol/gamma-HCH transport system permease protein